MKRGTPDHPKTLDLADRLGVESWGAVGVLESLWHWTARFAVAGNIGKFSNDQIARGIGWRGDAEKLIGALFESRWIDKSATERLVVHDWHDHADDAAKKYIERNKLKFLSYEVETCRDISVQVAICPPRACALPLPLPDSEPIVCPSQTAATNGSSLFHVNDETVSNQSVITCNQTEQNLITEKPKKKKEPPKQLNGYNPVVLWIDAVYRNMHVKTKLVGKDIGLLNALGNMYDKFEYPAMLVAYEQIWRKDMTRPWSVYWFYTHRDLYRSKARPANIAPDPGSDEELEKWMRK